MWFRLCGMLGFSWFIYKINLNVCFTEAMWNLLRSTLHIKIPNDFLTPTNTWNGIKEIKVTMRLSIFSSIPKGWRKKNLLKMIVSSLWVLEGCCASLQWVAETGTWNSSSRVDTFPPSIEQGADWPWPRCHGRAGCTLQSYKGRNDSGKEHWTTVTCTFYSLSNEAPHEVGTVFTPVRAPERVHLEDSSRKRITENEPPFHRHQHQCM